MANRKTKGKINLELPEGVFKIADLGDGIIVAKVSINILKEQDKNAHLMKPEMFRQLHENIKKRGTLESLPYCALTDKGVEIVSGHHRYRAAKEAGLKEIFVLLDTSGLNRSQIAAKQIAHNALVGFDDSTVLREIAQMINDVDDMIESYIGKGIIAEQIGQLEKYISPILNYDFKEVEFMFLPHQIEDLEKLVKSVQGKKDYIGAAHISQFEKLLITLTKYQKFSDIVNLGAAIHRIIEVANVSMDNAGYDENTEWVPLSRIVGNAAIPKETADKIKTVLDRMEKKELIQKTQRWKGIEILCERFINEAEQAK